MRSSSRIAFAIALAVLSCGVRPVMTQTQATAQTADFQIYTKFRAWATKLPPGTSDSDAEKQ